MDPIMMIIMLFIMMFMGGGTFPFITSDMQPAYYHTVSTEYTCNEVVWTQPPQVANWVFTGTAEIGCEFAGLDGGGIAELNRHMVSQLPAQANRVNSGPNAAHYLGLPSTHFDVTLETQSDSSTAEWRGETHIATDQITRLKNVFLTSPTGKKGAAKYVYDIYSEIDVQTTAERNWYRANMTSSPRLRVPPLVSAKAFYYYMKNNTEEQLRKKSTTIVHDLAENL